MEVLLMTGLGLLGWTLSAKGKDHRAQRTPHLRMTKDDAEYPVHPDANHTLLDEDTQRIKDHVQRTQQAIDEWRHGPFQASDKTAAVDTHRKLDLFTGTNETSWKHKDTYVPLFEPTEKRTYVNSGGVATSKDPLYDERDYVDRNVFIGTMNNTLPFEQQRVGPGLGYDGSVPAADGLHSTFRVMPTHAMNEHRINQLPGRSTSGAAHVQHGSKRYDEFHQKTPSLVNHVPNVGPGRTHLQAQRVNPTVDHKPTRSDGVNTHEYTVTTSGATYHNAGTQNRPEVHTQLNQQFGNLPNTRTGDTRTHATYDGCGTNLRDLKAGTLVYNPDDLFTGTVAAEARGPMQDEAFVMKPTARGAETPYTPGGKAVNTFGSVRYPTLEASNARELQGCNTGASSYLKATSARPDVVMGPGREQENTMQHGAMQGGTWNGQQGEVSTRIKKENVYDTITAPHGAHAPFAIQRESPGHTTTKRKISSINPRSQPDSMGLGLVCVSD